MPPFLTLFPLVPSRHKIRSKISLPRVHHLEIQWLCTTIDDPGQFSFYKNHQIASLTLKSRPFSPSAPAPGITDHPPAAVTFTRPDPSSTLSRRQVSSGSRLA